MRILHTGDWHLSAQGSRIDPETGLNARLMDFYRCARFSIEEGIRQGAELILHAGDAFNGAKPSPTELFLFREAIEPALEAGIPMVLLLGNHDMPRNAAEKNALDPLRDITGLTVVDQPCLFDAWQTIRAPGSQINISPSDSADIYADNTIVQIACLPWPNKQLLLGSEEQAGLTPAEIEQLMSEKLLDVARGLAAQRRPGVPCVLLAHLSVDLAKSGGQNRLMAYGGEWTINLHDLQSLGFDAVMLGHIHKPQTLHFDSDAACKWIGYSGSPEACGFGEEGEEKGFFLHDLANESHSFNLTPYRKHETLDFPNGKPWLPEDVKDAIVRLRIPEAMADQARALIAALEVDGAHEVQIEIIRSETTRRRETGVEAAMSKEEALRIYLHQRPDIAALEAAVIAEHRALAGKLEGGAV